MALSPFYIFNRRHDNEFTNRVRSPTARTVSTEQTPTAARVRSAGVSDTPSSLHSMEVSKEDELSSSALEHRLINNASRAVKHVIHLHPMGAFDQGTLTYPAVTIKAMLVFTIDGKAAAALTGNLETLPGEELYSQALLEQLDWERQKASIIEANPGVPVGECYRRLANTALWPAYESAEPPANKAFRESAEKIAAGLKIPNATTHSKIVLTLISLDEKKSPSHRSNFQVVHDAKVQVSPHDAGDDYFPRSGTSYMDGPANIDFFIRNTLPGCNEAEIDTARRFFLRAGESV